MKLNNSAIIKLILILAAIVIIFASLSRLLGGKDNKTLAEYASENPELAYASGSEAHQETGADDSEKNSTNGSDKSNPDRPDGSSQSASDGGTQSASGSSQSASDSSQSAAGGSQSASGSVGGAEAAGESKLTGAALNGSSMEELRVTFQNGFYYEPLSDRLRRYITGVTYPADAQNMAISYDDLRYVRVRHIDFDGNPAEGELICNKAIAQDLVEIFYELYRNEYAIEKIRLIDEYDGDDEASMEDNNTSCFNYRVVEGKSTLSKHALGRAIDINPYYNPYITYRKDGGAEVSPASAIPYADRTADFAYKIDEEDLCYKLFTEHGFTWGGNWNTSKDYQHFQKTEE